MAPTMLDVAALAGVSAKTVSRVVNDEPGVAPATRERVLAAIARTRFSPDPAARSLRTGRSGVIGLAVPELSQPFFAEIADRIATRAGEHGLSVVLGVTGELGEGEEAFVAGHPELDGTIVYWQGMSRHTLAELARRRPLVVLGEKEHDEVDRVTMDNAGGIDLVVAHLEALGREHIAVLGAPDPEVWTHGAGRTRMAAFREAMVRHGLEIDERLLIVSTEWRRRDGALAARRLLEVGAPFDAVVSFNDALALGALHELAAAGVRVPEDAAVTGFDNLESSRYANPSLTTVSPRLSAYATDAVRLLRERIESPDGPPRTVVEDVMLLPRDSSVGGGAP
ncbi:MAG: LacI family DNA-binding transcriptional regulator [Actinomyces sp.]|uniref:LacI family DNA-binding transcriptional regulator n=1 Tax=Actinomyces sp. TaxID=29317 RepID=UPI0026DC7F4F|nr:LacI family DNA-binding transcriptional regulator [Actinomyces sp.]MDO4242931.1 LacI family DNA-binding transcriptional regulator [Actinomyces sp.]